MRLLKNILSFSSMLTCIIALAVFVVCLIVGLYGKLLMWSGLISFFAWLLFLVSSSVSCEKMDENYTFKLRR